MEVKAGLGQKGSQFEGPESFSADFGMPENCLKRWQAQFQERAEIKPKIEKVSVGKNQIKVCRTLSCALGGSGKLHRHLCGKLGLDPHKHGAQTTPDGKFSVEFVECLAGCGAAPVMMCNDEFYESVSNAKADDIVAQCK